MIPFVNTNATFPTTFSLSQTCFSSMRILAPVLSLSRGDKPLLWRAAHKAVLASLAQPQSQRRVADRPPVRRAEALVAGRSIGSFVGL